MTALRECPCCGNSGMWNPKETATGTYDDNLGFVDCPVCGLRTEGRTSRDIATEAWNRRAATRETREAIEECAKGGGARC